jgi:putative acetyltransferase
MNYEIRPETAEDQQAIRHVNRAAFGADDEANLVDALRDGGFVEVSLVAQVNGDVVGHILFSRLSIITNSGIVEALSLAPLAVVPNHQRRGIGSKLVGAGLQACREKGHQIVLVLGHPKFYPRFGFSAELAQPLSSPFGGSEAWMALELVPDALKGVSGKVRFASPFGEFE